jgi:hypothetical protein
MLDPDPQPWFRILTFAVLGMEGHEGEEEGQVDQEGHEGVQRVRGPSIRV